MRVGPYAFQVFANKVSDTVQSCYVEFAFGSIIVFIIMEADSTGTESLNELKDFETTPQKDAVQSSQVSSCEEDTISSTDVNKAINNVLSITSDLLDGPSGDNSTNTTLDDGHVAFQNLSVQNVDQEQNSANNEIVTEIKSESVACTILTEEELVHIEESVLAKYTGLNIDLASENQLLKEDVIKCRCELEKYGKKLAALERKLDKANSYNDDLRAQVDKLSSEVHEYRREKHKIFVHMDTQTTAEDLMEVDDTLYDVNLPGTKTDADDTFDWKEDVDGQTSSDTGQDSLQTPGMSIADSLKVTAEAAMNQTGFVYDEQSGLYYDYNTGYYYNAEKGLYYDPKSGTYFYYNKSTGKYEFHSQVDLSYYTPKLHGYSDRSHGSYHHGYSDKYSSKYSERSPEHVESSSGKKKKKKESKRRDSEEKESRRRSSDEKEHKKKKRRKDKSRDNSDNSDDGNTDRKKRKTSTEDRQRSSAIIDEINKKIQDRSNIVMGELNYKKLQQSDKLFCDSLNKPKILKEKQANVSICDDVLKEEANKPKGGMGLGGRKIKLVLKKKEKDDENDESNSKVEQDEKKSDEKMKDEKNKSITKSDEKSEVDNSLNTVSNENKEDEKSDNVKANDDSKIKHDKLQNTRTITQVEKDTQESTLKEVPHGEIDKSETDASTTNPFLITGYDGDDGMLNYDKVGIVNNEEILRICSELNNEDTDEEDNSGPQKTAEITANKNSSNENEDKLPNNNSSTKVTEEVMDKEMLGVDGTEKLSESEKITKIPAKRGEDSIYSDDDDIMIVEKEEEKIMIELDSDDSDHEQNKWDSEHGLEPGELVNESSLSSSSLSSSSSSSQEQDAPVKAPWVEIVRQPTPATEESLLKNAPCIRAMVTDSDILDQGMLFIVTINGGMVGREPRPDLVIPIPDINVSKVHAEIRYNRKQQFYSIQDKGSQNGTYHNEVRISETKRVSKWVQLKHEDTLQFSCTRFEIHIHPGTDTCKKCEPGLVVQPPVSSASQVSTESLDKRIQHRQQLKDLKKKYGLTNSAYTDNMSAIHKSGYQDKAQERRKTVGSDHPHVRDDMPSSIFRSIEEDNKGHKLLKKLGWSEGESLGKDNTGIQEPINILLRVDQSAGLGALGKANEMSISNIGLVSARRRYQQSQMRYSLAASDSSKDKQFEPKLWVQGDTQFNSNLINDNSNKN